MTVSMKDLRSRGKRAAHRAVEKVETRVLSAIGRKAVRTRARKVAKVGRRVAKAALITGSVAAAAVAVRQFRRRRRG